MFGKKKKQQAAEVNTDFMREEIKQRPVNKKRLLRRTLTTAFLAVLFGAIACTVFLMLEPVIEKYVNPQKDAPVPVAFPEEIPEDEMSPEEMIADDYEFQKAQTSEAVSQAVSQLDISSLDTRQIEKSISEDILQQIRSENLSADGYRMQYEALSDLADEAFDSMVVVTGISSDYDWTGDVYENTGKSSGAIIADTEDKLLILTQGRKLVNVERIIITFANGDNVDAFVRARDTITGLTVLCVNKSDLQPETEDAISIAVLGSSAKTDLLGRPVIALGAPTGTQGSVSYGIVTNALVEVDVADSGYNLITTDIYGSAQADGVLIDMDGQIIGWIDMRYNKIDTVNLISAFGITEIKTLIEHMSNRRQLSCLGIHGTTVPENVHTEQGVPVGVYVRRVEIDSPAMVAGVQSGDIITSFNGNELTSFRQLTSLYGETDEGEDISLTIMRQGIDGYTQAQLSAEADGRLDLPDEDD